MATIRREKDYHLTVTVHEYNLIMRSLLAEEINTRRQIGQAKTPFAKQAHAMNAERLQRLRASIV